MSPFSHVTRLPHPQVQIYPSRSKQDRLSDSSALPVILTLPNLPTRVSGFFLGRERALLAMGLVLLLSGVLRFIMP